MLGKQHRMAIQIRTPLGNNSSIVNGARAPSGVSSTRPRLPRTLPRPALREIDMSVVERAYPDLKGLAPQYIRDKLPLAAPQMLEALRSIHACVPNSSLPQELEVEMTSESELVRASAPTHMLAVYSPSVAGKTKVVLYPSHQLVLNAHCSHLPALPAPPTLATSATSLRLPVVPLRLPAPEAFPLLHSYLYTKRADILLTALAPVNESDGVSLSRAATLIRGIWQDTCALGVVDTALFNTLDSAWARIMSAIERIQN
ncbi:hypothetical protein AMATHDRAFT_86130 [Amanita thiersii Skay4041]|uniref:Clp1-like protein n=1 Tax=Amanita thiersii Skay4041 TaxID=703135 RepID=A0A2A9NNQ9_9AGAR|nr:hypothetical protein AMATHDRAFT_86130 [Amanita thiersii Skay4041]